jgi:undecaprenyl-diphosphatase
MTVVLHFATALSTIIVFRKDIIHIVLHLFSPNHPDERRFAWMIIISMIPAAIIGITMEDWMDQNLTGNIWMVCIALLATAALLVLADSATATDRSVHAKDALIIGLAQAIAIIPGISRSGATIGTSVLLGIDREKAARFSFLMVVPLILGKMAKDLLDGDLSATSIGITELSVGFTAALLTGILACTWMIKLVKQSQLKYFAIYCAIVAIIGLLYLSFGS